MESELKLLEEKINRLIALTQSLASDNAELRASLLNANQQISDMQANMQKATMRVEQLLAELPEVAT